MRVSIYFGDVAVESTLFPQKKYRRPHSIDNRLRFYSHSRTLVMEAFHLRKLSKKVLEHWEELQHTDGLDFKRLAL
jgi:hypothetical protein